MTDLFDKDAKESVDNISHKNIPLAEKLRPKVLDEVIGQDKTLASDGQLKSMVKSGKLSSIIFWGPPGVGKTTLARVIANEVSAHYEEISAIFSGVSDLKKLLTAATVRHSNGVKTILFVDEIHRFNKLNSSIDLTNDGHGSLLYPVRFLKYSEFNDLSILISTFGSILIILLY